MLSLVLNIIGIILVLYSIIIIKKDISMIKDDKNNIIDNDLFKEEIFDEEILENFEVLMDSKIQSSEVKNKQVTSETMTNQLNKQTMAIIKDHRISGKDDNINPLHKKIIELESIGLNNEEIAKKMGKGVREIDIILKIYKETDKIF